ncbi:MAG: hypothetical protein J2P51_14975, partial [Hyphomicrobiaceae bacterium]|nr:hypothetical protein [Hyphomicrobiaceae bacterium]
GQPGTAAGQTRDLPVPVQGACVHARVYDHAGSAGRLRERTRPCCLPQWTRRRHPGFIPIAAQWLAYTFPCRRFARSLATTDARLGADVVRYSFIAADFHHLLLAGLPAHVQ